MAKFDKLRNKRATKLYWIPIGLGILFLVVLVFFNWLTPFFPISVDTPADYAVYNKQANDIRPLFGKF